MAKGLNINAAPFEPGFGSFGQFVVNQPPPIFTPYCPPDLGYINSQWNAMQEPPPMYYYGSQYQANSPVQVPMLLGPQQVTWSPPALQHQKLPPHPPPHPPPLPPPPLMSPPPLENHHHNQRRSVSGRNINSSVLKVLTGSAAPIESSSSSRPGVPMNNNRSQQQPQTQRSNRWQPQQEPSSSSPSAAAAAKPRSLLSFSVNPPQSLRKPTQAVLPLASAEEFPALGAAAGGASSLTSCLQPQQQQQHQFRAPSSLTADSTGSTSKSKEALAIKFTSYSDVIRRKPSSQRQQPPPPQEASPLAENPPQSAKADHEGNGVGQDGDGEEKKKSGSQVARVAKPPGRSKRRARGKKNKKATTAKKLGGGKSSTENPSSAVAEQTPPAGEAAKPFQLIEEEFPAMGAALPKPLAPHQPTSSPCAIAASAPVAPPAHARKSARSSRQSLLFASGLVVAKATAKAAAAAATAAAPPAPPLRVGKQRERPKAKKKSLTKKIILLERQARQKAVAAVSSSAPASTEATLPLPSLPPPASVDAAADEVVAAATAADASAPDCVQTAAATASSLATAVPAASAAKTLHSRRFREYCDQLIVKSVQEVSSKLLHDLLFFQSRARARDPAKAKQKRRLVMGLREARKHISLGRIRLVFISPDLERVQAPGGLDDTVNQLIELCQQKSVPYVFGLKRREMGRVLKKSVPVSVVAVFDYQGCEASVNHLLDLVRKAKEDYQLLTQMAAECTSAPATNSCEADDKEVCPVAAAASAAASASVVAASPSVALTKASSSLDSLRPQHSRNPSDTSSTAALSEPISEELPEHQQPQSATSRRCVTAPSRSSGRAPQLQQQEHHGFHSRQSSLGVVVIGQPIEEVASVAIPEPADVSKSKDKVASWLCDR